MHSSLCLALRAAGETCRDYWEAVEGFSWQSWLPAPSTPVIHILCQWPFPSPLRGRGQLSLGLRTWSLVIPLQQATVEARPCRAVALAGSGRVVDGWSLFNYNLEPCRTPLPTGQLGEQLSVTQLKQQEILRGALQSKSLNDPVIRVMKTNHTSCRLPTPSPASRSQHQAVRCSCSASGSETS